MSEYDNDRTPVNFPAIIGAVLGCVIGLVLLIGWLS
jgi:hypothetical protein